MPQFTKLSDEEVRGLTTPKPRQNPRELNRQKYIAYLRDFQPGDWVSVELEEGEKRITEKNRLNAAAKALGYKT